MRSAVLFILILLISFNLKVVGQGSNDCFNIKTLEPGKIIPVKPLPQVRANEVMWHRRLWREIDLKEKINQLLYFPNEKEDRNCCMFDLLIDNVNKGLIKAYNPNTDDFSIELSLTEIKKIMSDSIMVDGKLTLKALDSKDVVKYWLKEDWFFNSNYSKIEVRIIGICPVKVKRDQQGNILGYEQLFWLYYPHIRGVLTNTEAFKKEKEDDPRVSFDDIFLTRMFNSCIILKEGKRLVEVKENKTELDIKLENEKTKAYFFNEKTKLWGN